MAGVVHIQWYATLLRSQSFVEAVAEMAAPVAMSYGATRYTVQRSQDDHYRILLAIWFDSKDDWYRYWEGPELIEFRARTSGHYQIPVVYAWHDELAADEKPANSVKLPSSASSQLDPEPQAAA
jgi:hypothetical protein